MIVYRVCREEEVNKILDNEDFSKLGNYFSVDDMSKKNNHRYESNQLYLHFFKNRNDILYLKELKGKYLCSYDIPIKILEEYEGVGYYYDLLKYLTLYDIVEYAIKSSVILPEYLIRIEYINDEIDIDDYLVDCELNDFFELRYMKDNSKKLIKIL